MKRRALERHLRRNGCTLRREGGRHSVYWHPESGRTTVIPRHVEIEDHLVRKICRDLGAPEP